MKKASVLFALVCVSFTGSVFAASITGWVRDRIYVYADGRSGADTSGTATGQIAFNSTGKDNETLAPDSLSLKEPMEFAYSNFKPGLKILDRVERPPLLTPGSLKDHDSLISTTPKAWSAASFPEPAILLFLGTSLIALAGYGRKKL